MFRTLSSGSLSDLASPAAAQATPSSRSVRAGQGRVDGRHALAAQLAELQARAESDALPEKDVVFLDRILKRLGMRTGSSSRDLDQQDRPPEDAALASSSGPSSGSSPPLSPRGLSPTPEEAAAPAAAPTVAAAPAPRLATSPVVSMRASGPLPQDAAVYASLQSAPRISAEETMMGHLFSKALPRGATLRSRKVAKERARLEFLERNMSAHARQIATAPARDQPPDLPSSKIKLDFQYTLSDTKRYIIEKDPLSDRTETHITRFNERSLLKWAWLRTVKGTVFSYPSAPFIWIQLFILLIVAFATAIITYISFKHLDQYSNIPWFHFDNHEITEVFEVLDEFQVIGGTSEMLTTLVAFVLGLYVAKTVDIWWELRHGQVQTILNTIDGLSMRMAIYFPGTSPEDMEAKNTILRYGALSVKLLFKDCKEIDAWTLADRMESGCDNLIDLENEGLITPDEVELLMNCPCKSQVVWVWIASYVTKWCLDGRLPNPLENQEKILEECIEARNAIANILARINTQFPLSYTHLVVFMIKFLLFVHAIIAGYLMCLAYLTGYWYQGCVQFTYLIIWTVFHMGLINIKEHIANPFRDNPCDFSSQMFTARTCNQSSAFHDAASNPPYTEGLHRAAALPPQLIVRQLYGGRMKPRTQVTPSAAGPGYAHGPASPRATPDSLRPVKFGPRASAALEDPHFTVSGKLMNPPSAAGSEAAGEDGEEGTATPRVRSSHTMFNHEATAEVAAGAVRRVAAGAAAPLPDGDGGTISRLGSSHSMFASVNVKPAAPRRG